VGKDPNEMGHGVRWERGRGEGEEEVGGLSPGLNAWSNTTTLSCVATDAILPLAVVGNWACNDAC